MDSQKLGDMIKTWLPIILSIGSIVVSYVLFKANTEHQFEIMEIRNQELAERVDSLAEELDRNKTEWQRDVEARLMEIRETNLQFEFRLNAVEESVSRSSSSSSSRSTSSSGSSGSRGLSVLRTPPTPFAGGGGTEDIASPPNP